MSDFFSKKKIEQKIEGSELNNSNVTMVAGDLIIDSDASIKIDCGPEMGALFAVFKKDTPYLNQRIEQELESCESLILESNKSEAIKIINSILTASPVSINDTNQERLHYLKVISYMLSNDSTNENIKLHSDKIKESEKYKKNIEIGAALYKDSDVEFRLDDKQKADEILLYMILHISFKKSRFDYIVTNFKPDKNSFHFQDYFYGLGCFRKCRYTEASRALHSAIKKKALPQYKFYHALSSINESLIKCQQEAFPPENLKKQYEDLIALGNDCPDLREINSIPFNLAILSVLIYTEPKKFLDVYSKLLDEQKNDTIFRSLLADYYFQIGDYKESINIYKEIPVEDFTEEISYQFMMCYYLQADYNLIIDLFEKSQFEKTASTISIYLKSVHEQEPKKFDNCFNNYFPRYCNSGEDLLFFLQFFYFDKSVKVSLYNEVRRLKDDLKLATNRQKLKVAFFAAEADDIDLSLEFMENINNLTDNIKLICKLIYNLSSLETQKILVDWFLCMNIRNPEILHILGNCHIASNKYISAFEAFRESFTQYNNRNVAIQLIELAVRLSSVKIEDVQAVLDFLRSEKEPMLLIKIAKLYSKFGDYNRAKKISFQAIYYLGDEENTDFYNLYISIWHENHRKNSSTINHNDIVEEDMVVDLELTTSEKTEMGIITSNKKNETSNFLRVCINQEGYLSNDCEAIGALHISTKNPLYVRLMNSKINETVEYSGDTYKIISVVDKYLYADGYVLDRINPSNDGVIIKKFYLDSNGDINKQLYDQLSEYNLNADRLEDYHFQKNNFSTPIECIFKSSYHEYAHTVMFLLFGENQILYAGRNGVSFCGDQTYTITPSSLVVLGILDNLNILNEHASKIFISESLVEFIKEQSINSRKYLAVPHGTVSLGENKNIVFTPPDDQMPDFWSNLYETALKFNLRSVTNEERVNFSRNNAEFERLLYDRSITSCQIDAFILSSLTDSILMTDDIFYRFMAIGLGIISVNHTHLYSARGIEEYQEAFSRILKTNFWCIPIQIMPKHKAIEYMNSIAKDTKRRRLYDYFVNSIRNASE